MTEFPVNTLKEIEKLTDQNYHIEARILVSRAIGNDYLKQKYQSLFFKQKRLGYMDCGMMYERRYLDKDLFDYIEATYSNAKALYMCF